MTPWTLFMLDKNHGSVGREPARKEACTMGDYGGRSRSSEDQIWERIDRMRDAGPVSDF